ncbi:DUF1707 domain-containing protein [Amycolatopsis sp. DG1A-15b]|uniref:DUF1707 SHOCT-like domain-containing protein n=1 Tax=Amycolatopsis sp. DG1A-15b TaxID=3052846 RepID=UPI00255BD072|nr:DUF1707 domain-containing protein [Amycolatopsis sp. DG1A-15b]WIX93369.1 DUF1707 domain-containing protein [Amycolatopsis sp. DG1A-15b]
MPERTDGDARLRVSDAEREHVVAQLTTAIGRGLIDLAEFTTRTDRALAARTRGDLNVLLLDLPGLFHPDDPAASWQDDRVELWENGGRIVRRGGWRVPETLVLRPRTRTLDLDFGAARIEHRQVRIELHGGSTQVRLRLPVDATVDVGGLATKRGRASRVRDKTGFVGTGGTPHFVLTGHSASGQVRLIAADFPPSACHATRPER